MGGQTIEEIVDCGLVSVAVGVLSELEGLGRSEVIAGGILPPPTDTDDC